MTNIDNNYDNKELVELVEESENPRNIADFIKKYDEVSQKGVHDRSEFAPVYFNQMEHIEWKSVVEENAKKFLDIYANFLECEKVRKQFLTENRLIRIYIDVLKRVFKNLKSKIKLSDYLDDSLFAAIYDKAIKKDPENQLTDPIFELFEAVNGYLKKIDLGDSGDNLGHLRKLMNAYLTKMFEGARSERVRGAETILKRMNLYEWMKEKYYVKMIVTKVREGMCPHQQSPFQYITNYLEFLIALNNKKDDEEYYKTLWNDETLANLLKELHDESNTRYNKYKCIADKYASILENEDSENEDSENEYREMKYYAKAGDKASTYEEIARGIRYVWQLTESSYLKLYIEERIKEKDARETDAREKCKKISLEILDLLRLPPVALASMGECGHYTGLSTMMNCLIKGQRVKEEELPYLRLTNANQLNDPMEGKVLLDRLGLQYSSYQATKVYLSSLTVAKDSLPMWRGYGDNAAGVFLEYAHDYLERIIKDEAIEFAKICYINDIGKTNNGIIDYLLDELKTTIDEVRARETDEALESIQQSLSQISYLFKDASYSHEQEYRIFVDFDGEKIKNWLGKQQPDEEQTSDSTQPEYRIFVDFDGKKFQGLLKQQQPDGEKDSDKRQHETDKNNKNKMKLLANNKGTYANSEYQKYIHFEKDDSGQCKLYTYITVESIKYSKVMLGSKVTNIDYIIPYLKHVQDNLEIEYSIISYR